jgi:magnesium transporter
MRNFYYRSAKDSRVKTLQQPRSGCWINVEDAVLEDIEHVALMTGLTVPDIDDALDVFEIPRIEHHENTIIIFTKIPSDKDDRHFTKPLTIIINDQYFITISLSSNAIIDTFVSQTNLHTTQRSKFLLQLLLTITDSFTRRIKAIRNEVQQKSNTYDDVTETEITVLSKNEQILNQYLVDLIPMRNVLEAILSGKHLLLYEEDSDLVEDILISIRQSVDVCRVNLKSIQTIRNAHHIIFTNKLNKTMKLLTSFTIILTIPTIIASMYGMNIELPFMHHPLAFLIVLTITAGFSTTALYIFRKLQWM